jgi:nitrite reductase/ring-hydroxylating ferredoxin subunit
MKLRAFEMWIEAARNDELMHNGLKTITANGKEIVLCNCDGQIFAIDRRCGHMNAPLEMGTLDDHYITCPMHHVQFDVKTGEALNRPVPHYFGEEPEQKILNNFPNWIANLMAHIKTCNIKTYSVKIDNDSIKIDM